MKTSYMTFMTPEWSLAEVIDGARRHGYDGVELRVEAGHRHGVEPDSPAGVRQDARQRFADSGVALACIATSCRFADSDPEKRRANVESLKRHVALAADVGAPGIRVFGGVRPEGMSMADAIAVVAKDLAKACEMACAAGVGIWLETHDHFSRAAEVAAVLAQAGCPCIAANWDIMHPFRAGESTEETWRHLQQGKLVRHAHLHDGRWDDGRMVLLPIGEGVVPFHGPLRLLRDAGYEGYLSAEYWAELGPPDEGLARYIEGVRKVLGEV